MPAFWSVSSSYHAERSSLCLSVSLIIFLDTMLRAFSVIGYLSQLTLTASTCYYPLGGVSNDVPCDPDADVSMCCSHRSECLTNGLCQLQDINTSGKGYARGTCTDRTWTSSICPQHCQVSKSKRVKLLHPKWRLTSLPQIKIPYSILKRTILALVVYRCGNAEAKAMALPRNTVANQQVKRRDVAAPAGQSSSLGLRLLEILQALLFRGYSKAAHPPLSHRLQPRLCPALRGRLARHYPLPYTRSQRQVGQ